MKTRYLSATDFKAHCLALLDEVGQGGGTITVTKRGRPVATVGPVEHKPRKSLKGAWVGRVRIPDELLDEDTADLWEVVRGAEAGK